MKTKPDMIIIAKNFAQMAHIGQFRRDGKTPYFYHVDGVARIVSPQKAEYIATAYLHDIIEDTSYNHFDLMKIGMPKMVINAVLILTKYENQSYDDYLKKVKDNVITKAVKIADMTYNLNDTPSQKQIEKYKKGIEFLNS